MSGDIQPAWLVLRDGAVFEGEAIGAAPEGGAVDGEVVFNTSLSGYQEIISDPSYCGQIIVFTYPHIGNYGVTQLDEQAHRPFCRGVVIRDMSRRRSNWRSEGDLDSYLKSFNLMGIAGVDTRRLTRHIRDHGSLPGAIGTDLAAVKAKAAAAKDTSGQNMAAVVSTTEPYTFGTGPRRVVAYDFGVKRAILQQLGDFATVEVVPWGTSAADVLARNPEGVFLSNGPGDPSAVAGAAEQIQGLLDQVPVFGICLGHQILAEALGGSTYKMPFGHHGGNHPVQRLETGCVEITSQNHNYAVTEGSLASADVTHVNLNDGVIEGIACRDVPAFSVQYHPEASPGPHDARYLFQMFEDLMNKVKAGEGINA